VSSPHYREPLERCGLYIGVRDGQHRAICPSCKGEVVIPLGEAPPKCQDGCTDAEVILALGELLKAAEAGKPTSSTLSSRFTATGRAAAST